MADKTGVKSAAQRKLHQELGIPPEQCPTDSMQYLTRIHYLAPCSEIWGEHEIDHILVIRGTVNLTPNPNEVRDYKYVTKEELKEMIAQAGPFNFYIT
jgi:isopentenyl-diphosphate delta-isomerase